MTQPKIIPIRASRKKVIDDNAGADAANMPQGKPRSVRSTLTKAVLMILSLGLVMSVFLLIGVFLLGQDRALSFASHGISAIKPFAVLIHLAVIAIIAVCWQRIVRYLQARNRITTDTAALLMASRKRIVIAMIVLEVVLVIGIPFRW